MTGQKGKRGARLSLIGRDPDAAFYAAEAVRRGGDVLVLGCADGRIAWEVAETGPKVVGVDPSAVMVEAAESRRHSVPVELAARVRFETADFRSLRLSETFPLVLAPQNALGLMGSLDDLAACLATVHHHLQPGGTLVFDVLNTPRDFGLPLPATDSQDVDHPSGPLEPARPVFAPHLRERKREGGGKGETSIRRLRLRHFSAEEMDEALREAGFLALERYGSFDRKPFDEQSPLQVVHAVLDTRPPAGAAEES